MKKEKVKAIPTNYQKERIFDLGEIARFALHFPGEQELNSGKTHSPNKRNQTRESPGGSVAEITRY